MIDITYRSSKSKKPRGRVTKKIKVHSNDSSQPLAELKVTSKSDKSLALFEVNPEAADFDQILAGKKEKMKLELVNADTTMTKLAVIGEPTDEFVKRYKIKKDKLKPGQKTEIEIELRDDLQLGAFKTALTLEVEGNPGSRYSIPITGAIVNEIIEKPAVAQNRVAKKSSLQAAAEEKKIEKNIEKKTAVSRPNIRQFKPREIVESKPVITRDDSDLK